MPLVLTRRALLSWIGASVVAAGLPAGRGAQGSPWLPFVPGLRRSYSATQGLVVLEEGEGKDRPLRANDLGSLLCEEEILSVRPEGEGLAAEVEQRWASPGGSSRMTWRWRPGGVLADAGPMSTAVGEVRTLSSEGWFLPDDVAPGRKWAAEVVYESPISRIHVHQRARCWSEELIDTPAGRFETLQVEVQTKTRVEHLVATLAPLSSEQEEHQFFARGVGLVLVGSRAANGYQASKVLTGFVSG